MYEKGISIQVYIHLNKSYHIKETNTLLTL